MYHAWEILHQLSTKEDIAYEVLTPDLISLKAQSLAILGMLHQRGAVNPDDEEENEQKAFQYFSKAAQLGSVLAQKDLGFHYFTGKGTVKDTSKALLNFKKSASANFPGVRELLGMIYQRTSDAERQEGAAFFLPFAKSGDKASQLALAQCYDRYTGHGPMPNDCEEINVLRSALWYKKYGFEQLGSFSNHFPFLPQEILDLINYKGELVPRQLVHILKNHDINYLLFANLINKDAKDNAETTLHKMFAAVVLKVPVPPAPESSERLNVPHHLHELLKIILQNRAHLGDVLQSKLIFPLTSFEEKDNGESPLLNRDEMNALLALFTKAIHDAPTDKEEAKNAKETARTQKELIDLSNLLKSQLTEEKGGSTEAKKEPPTLPPFLAALLRSGLMPSFSNSPSPEASAEEDAQATKKAKKQ